MFTNMNLILNLSIEFSFPHSQFFCSFFLSCSFHFPSTPLPSSACFSQTSIRHQPPGNPPVDYGGRQVGGGGTRWHFFYFIKSRRVNAFVRFGIGVVGVLHVAFIAYFTGYSATGTFQHSPIISPKLGYLYGD